MKNESKIAFLIVTAIFLIAIALSFFSTAGITWLIMYGLEAIGVAMPFAWSWWLSTVVWLVLILLASVFKRGEN